jgi:hypothetical protein
MASFTDNFISLNQILLKQLNFYETGRVEKYSVFSSELDIVKTYCDRILAGKERLPEIYHNAYIDPLVKNLKDIFDALRPIPGRPEGWDPRKYTFLTNLVNAALQPGQEQVMPYLSAIQGIVNEMYCTFLTSRSKLGIKTPLDQAISPLVGFNGPLPLHISEQAPMPSTFELEQIRQSDWLAEYASGFKVGTIVIPAGYLTAPLLWGVLGHEVGGHYTLTAGKGDRLLDELKTKIYHKVLKKYPKHVALLWRSWTEEAAADVCGVLNLGPSFGVGAISFYTAQMSLGKWSSSKEELSCVYEKDNDHPIQVLVPYVISGAIEALKQLGQSRKHRYTAQLDEIARFFSSEKKVIRFPDHPKLIDFHGRDIELPASQSLKKMQDLAHDVGYYIATVKLKTLEEYTLQDLVTWGDKEEDAALEIADHLNHRTLATDISNKGAKSTSLQLLSGGILAVIRNPDLYAHANEALSKELGLNYTEAQIRR